MGWTYLALRGCGFSEKVLWDTHQVPLDASQRSPLSLCKEVLRTRQDLIFNDITHILAYNRLNLKIAQ